MENEKTASVLYANSGGIPFAEKIGMSVRQRIFRAFLEKIPIASATRVLDVGVTCDQDHEVSNFFEKLYPYPSNVTCVGTEDGSHLERAIPGVKFISVAAGRPLPFGDGEFDAAFSNAVVEHTGGLEGQRFFVGEVCRVSKRFFIATPNRWFPVEPHTGLPFLHYLPKTWFRRLIRGTRYDYWSREENLNMLTMGDFRRLFPAGTGFMRVTYSGFTTNLVAYGGKNNG
jgi:hypothetical protein